ncbi:hypothetical protein FJZ39_00355 [Candidatus Saccharibacteria bacterium]|nr:hypothetical protein [Candidatus Saccharibacteria bacterium]
MEKLYQHNRLLSDAEIDTILEREIYPRYFSGITAPSSQPQLIYIAGQPGSGKSTREQHYTDALNAHEPHTAISINCDDMRQYHPLFLQLQHDDDITAAIKINPDNARFTSRLIQRSYETGCHVVLEGTFRDTNSVENTAEKYRKHNYAVRAQVLAVHPLISRVGVLGRYLKERKIYGVGRYTLPSAHDTTVYNLPHTVEDFIHKGYGSELSIINRENQTLFSYTADCETDHKSTAKAAQATLKYHHTRPLTPEEYLFAQHSLDECIDLTLHDTTVPTAAIDEVLALKQQLEKSLSL